MSTAKRILLPWLSICTILGAGSPIVWAQAAPNAPPTTEVRLANERWQALPADIRMVYVGPDGRNWYVAKLDPKDSDEAKAKADIAEQWSKPAPVLHHSRPALFEKSGRVWFITADGHMLYGYDSKTFVAQLSHAADRSLRAYLGDVPDHGRTTLTPCNIDLGNAQVFIETTGFTAFDGKNWIYQEVSPNENGPMELFPEPGGKSALALQRSPAHAWRFANGKWTVVPLGVPERTSFRAAVLMADGALLVQIGTNGLSRLPLDGSGIPNIGARQPMKFGDIDVNAQVPGLTGDLHGNFCISVGNLPVSTLPGRRGLIVVRADGSHTLIPLEIGGSVAPLFTDGGKTLWITSSTGIQRVDLSANSPKVTPVPDQSYTFMHAIAADGMVFVSTGAPIADGRYAGSDQAGAPPELSRVMAYKAQSADSRPTLAVKGVQADNTPAVLATDGLLWCSLVGTGVGRYDGAKWTTVHDHYALMTELYPGQNGEVLMWQGRIFTLWQGDKRIDGAALDDMVKANVAEFTKAFGASIDASVFRRTPSHSISNAALASGLPNGGGWSIAADKGGHIWMTISRTLRVLDRGQWVNVAWPEIPPAPNTKVLVPGPSLATPVGGGEAIFVYASREVDRASNTDNKPAPKVIDYVATFSNGKAELKPVEGGYYVNVFEDADRTIWLAQGARSPYEVRRIGPPGAMESFQISQVPALLDRSDIVWLTPANETFELLKDRKVVGKVTVPGADDTTKLVSDKPGSVWVWTPSGLQHYAADPARPADYQLRQTLNVQGEDGTPIAARGADFGISPRGFFFAVARTEGPGGKRYIYTGTLPAK